MSDKKSRNTEKDQNKKFEWADNQFVLSALSTVKYVLTLLIILSLK